MSSDDLPDPLTPPDCDLRGLEWMPLYGGRLFESETWLLAGPEGRCAALALWWASWKQRPAGSCPADVRVLSHLAGYGRDVQAWSGVQVEALRGWVKCNDGRLYHPVVCELALEAWARRQRERDRKANYRAECEARKNSGVAQNVPRTARGQYADKARTRIGTVPRTETGTVPATSPSRPAAVPGDRTGQDKTIVVSPPTPSSKSVRPPPEGSDDDEAFAAFWAAYPRREAKGQARRAWTGAVRKAAPEQIMAGLARYRFADDPKYRPLPATWLNGERWLDEAQPTPPPPATSAHTGTGALNGYAHPPPPDPDDAWGLIAWATRVCAGVTATFPGGVTKPAINHCDVLDLGRQVCEAAGIPPDARPRLDALAAWCRDDVWQPAVDPFDLHHGGNRLHAIMPAVRRQAERMRERGETVSSLAVFDATVRQASAAGQRARPPEPDDDGWPT